MIYIVGIGPGHRDYILPTAKSTLESCDLIIGYSRAISSIEFIKVKKIIIKTLSETILLLKENKDKKVAVVASGDPGFYGITEYIKRNMPEENIKIIPGISSFQYMMSALGRSWNEYYLSSVHGREEDFINLVMQNKKCIFLTDGKNSPKALAKELFLKNIDCEIYVGEDLSYPEEKITIGSPKEIMTGEFSSLSVFVVEVI